MPVKADNEAKQQLNGELNDKAEKATTTPGRGEADDDTNDEDDDDEGGEYIVESIAGHKIVKKEVLYEIKWQGYDESENTFEPEDNLLPYEICGKSSR